MLLSLLSGKLLGSNASYMTKHIIMVKLNLKIIRKKLFKGEIEEARKINPN